MGQTTVDVGHRLAVGRDDAPSMGACRLQRHLLAEHHPHRELLLVDRPRNPLPGRLGDQRRQVRVGAQRVDDRLGVGVEVQQPPAPGDRRGQIAEVVQHELALHVIGLRCETDDSVAVGQPQRSSVRAVAHFLDAGHRAGGQMAEQALVRERRAHRQPQRQSSGAGVARARIECEPAGAGPSASGRTPPARCR